MGLHEDTKQESAGEKPGAEPFELDLQSSSGWFCVWRELQVESGLSSCYGEGLANLKRHGAVSFLPLLTQLVVVTWILCLLGPFPMQETLVPNHGFIGAAEPTLSGRAAVGSHPRHAEQRSAPLWYSCLLSHVSRSMLAGYSSTGL